MPTWTAQWTTFWALSERRRQPELMDQPDLDPTLHAHALRGLARVNWLSRSAYICWPVLRAAAIECGPQPLRVLDVACGGGDVTVALARLARRERLAVNLAGCDLSDTALQIARRRAASASEAVEFFHHDAVQQSLPERFDVVICSLFLHHLDEPEAITVLRSMAQAASRLVLVNDLVRSRTAYALALLGTRLLTRSHIVHVDGPLSVAAAFTPGEALRISEQAGLTGATLTRHWPQRMLVTWSKPCP